MVVSPVFVGHDNVAIIVTIHLLVSLVDTPLVPGLGTAVAVGQLVKLGAQLLCKCLLAFNAIPPHQSILKQGNSSKYVSSVLFHTSDVPSAVIAGI